MPGRFVFLLVSVLAMGWTLPSRAELHLAIGACDGAPERSWLCNADAGDAFVVVASVDAPAMSRWTGFDAILDFGFEQPVPDWYRFGVGECRGPSALIATLDLQPDCADHFGAMSSRPALTWRQVIGPAFVPGDPYGEFGAERMRLYVSLRAESAAVAAAPVPEPGAQVQLFAIEVRRSGSTGAGACGGCSAGVCLEFPFLALHQPTDAGGDQYLYSRTGVMLQSVASPSVTCLHSIPSAAKSSTWGQVKSLYR